MTLFLTIANFWMLLTLHWVDFLGVRIEVGGIIPNPLSKTRYNYATNLKFTR